MARNFDEKIANDHHDEEDGCRWDDGPIVEIGIHDDDPRETEYDLSSIKESDRKGFINVANVSGASIEEDAERGAVKKGDWSSDERVEQSIVKFDGTFHAHEEE